VATPAAALPASAKTSAMIETTIAGDGFLPLSLSMTTPCLGARIHPPPPESDPIRNTMRRCRPATPGCRSSQNHRFGREAVVSPLGAPVESRSSSSALLRNLPGRRLFGVFFNTEPPGASYAQSLGVSTLPFCFAWKGALSPGAPFSREAAVA
jgi:hypothetical protein